MKKSANNSKIQTICFQCMEMKKTGSVCNHCGYDHRQYKSHPQFLEPGIILKKKYILGIPLGNDGFNNTYVAIDQKSNQRIVVKEYFPIGLSGRGVDKLFVKPHSDESQHELFVFGKRAFLKEAMTLSDIRMTNIVPIINYFSENNTAYIVSPFIEGTDLARHLVIRGGRLSVREAVDIMIPILATLYKLHKKNIFHYNLSPSKIMIVHQKDPIILGFGQAKQMMDKQSERIRKTIQYNHAPPEQYHPKGKFGPWSDVYCCGIILYQMMTGKLPQTADRRLKKDLWIPAIKCQGVTISKELSEVIDHSVSVEHSSRYKSAREFMQAIKSRMPRHSKPPGKTMLFIIILAAFIMSSFGLKYLYVEKDTDHYSSLVQLDIPLKNKTVTISKGPPIIEDIPVPDTKPFASKNDTITMGKEPSIVKEMPAPDKEIPVSNMSEPQHQTSTFSVKSPEKKSTIVNELRICGDQELCDHLTPFLIKAYLETKKVDHILQQMDDQKNVQFIGNVSDGTIQITIASSGTHTAFEMLQYNHCDVILSGKKMNASQQTYFSTIDEAEHSEIEHLIALDGIVIFNHSDNPVRSLTIKEVQDIFSGNIKQWDQIGGRSGDIRIYAPQSISDLYQEFKERMLAGKNIKVDQRFRYLDKLSKALSEDPNGIGICSLPFILDNQAIAIADYEIDPVRPSYFSISTDEYLLRRYLYLYTILVSASELTFPFVSFVQSPKGQDVIKQCGYVDCSVKALRSRRELWNKPVNPAVFKKLVDITKQSRKLSMNFYFKNNAYQLTSDGRQQMKQLISWLKHQPPSIKICVIGYSDSIGAYRHNCLVALRRAEMVAREMKTNGIYVDDIETACEEFPIASNQTETGRYKNRRVEIWLRY